MACVSVFIVNYNGARFINSCLDALLASNCSFDLDIIVIDNCSADDSLVKLALYKDRITILKNHYNSGFARANNICADYAKGDYYFLLNNDTIIQPNTLQLLYDYLIQFSDIGLIAPKLLNGDGSIQCSGSIFGQLRFYSKKPVDVSFLSGAALLIKKSIYHEVGGLDDNLFFYNEDLDLCKVLVKKKFRLVYYPLAELIHFGGLSTFFRSAKSLVEGYRGGFYVCYKHYSGIVYKLYRFLVLFDILPRFIFHFCLSLFLSKHRIYVGSYFDILKINWNNDIFITHPSVKVEVV